MDFYICYKNKWFGYLLNLGFYLFFGREVGERIGRILSLTGMFYFLKRKRLK